LYLHGGAYKGSKNLKKTRALHTLRKQSLGAITFCRINSVTYRIDRRTMNGVGCLMEVAWPGETRQRWVARLGDRASEPLSLAQAKAAATTLLTTEGKAEPRDWFTELDQIAANEVYQAYWTREKRTWPLDLIGGQRHAEKQPLMTIERRLRPAILNTERVLKDEESTAQPVNGDDFQLEYYSDGYPKLPECLDRRRKPLLVEAA
jgi:hypothetical protein